MNTMTDAGTGDIPTRPRWVSVLGWVALAALIAAQIYGLTQSPPDRDMGNLEKILYVHVPAAWNALLSYAGVFVMSVLYLWRRRERDDLIAASLAEVGTALTGLTLCLGSIWGRPTWGVWWAWDARLTSTAVLFVVMVGYLALRAFIEDPERRARWSAAVGILGFINAFIVYKSVQWWRTLHQVQSAPNTMSPVYVWALRFNAIAILLVMIYFVARRYYVARIERALDARLEQVALSGEEINV